MFRGSHTEPRSRASQSLPNPPEECLWSHLSESFPKQSAELYGPWSDLAEGLWTMHSCFIFSLESFHPWPLLQSIHEKRISAYTGITFQKLCCRVACNGGEQLADLNGVGTCPELGNLMLEDRRKKGNRNGHLPVLHTLSSQGSKFNWAWRETAGKGV